MTPEQNFAALLNQRFAPIEDALIDISHLLVRMHGRNDDLLPDEKQIIDRLSVIEKKLCRP